MNPRAVIAFVGLILAIVAASMLAPAALAVFDGDTRAAWAYGGTSVGTLLAAGLARFALGTEVPDLRRRDALAVVSITWLFLGIIGGLPFMIEGSIPQPTAALFEAVSGFTTTGATVVADVDGLSRATNLWRCEMHWLGGMGIVVLFVAVFPQFGVGAKHLFRSEVPGPITEDLRPRIRSTASSLWRIYAVLTLACAAAYALAGMPIFDSICHAFSTLGTGGFSNRGASIGYYDSPAIEWICCFFMLVAALNFGLYFGVVQGKLREFFGNYELRFYVAANLLIIAVVFAGSTSHHSTVEHGLRAATFQVLAVTTTTGFMTEDFDTYAELARALLFVAMFMGGCAGSTAGGIKASRIYTLGVVARREVGSVLDPLAVTTVRLGRSSLARETVESILVFVTTYLLIFVLASLALIALGMDLVSGSSATVACLSSIGPGLKDVGPTQNFGVVPPAGKVLLSVCMIAGRLEIFALLAVLDPRFWRRS